MGKSGYGWQSIRLRLFALFALVVIGAGYYAVGYLNRERRVMADLLKTCDDLKAKILASKHRYTGLELDLARLLPPDVLLVTPLAQLAHLPRYLKCIMVRAERAVLNPAKDKDKAAAENDFADWKREVTEANRETFRWLYEEYRVSIYAQELGTAQPVSLKRLEALIG